MRLLICNHFEGDVIAIQANNSLHWISLGCPKSSVQLSLDNHYLCRNTVRLLPHSINYSKRKSARENERSDAK